MVANRLVIGDFHLSTIFVCIVLQFYLSAFMTEHALYHGQGRNETDFTPQTFFFPVAQTKTHLDKELDNSGCISKQLSTAQQYSNKI